MTSRLKYAKRCQSVVCNEPTQKDVGVGAKAAWFAAEAFGKLAAAVKGTSNEPPPPRNDKILSATEIEERLKADWERQYFITGNMDLDIYEEDCEVHRFP